MYNNTKLLKGATYNIRKEMTDFANLLSQGGSRPSLLDTTFINLNLTFVTNESSGNVVLRNNIKL